MKILFLTFYYKPDLCAGSFRATPLAEELYRQLPPDSQIDVITTLPNRYHSFTSEAPQFERIAGISVHRIPLPTHKSGMIDQSKAFFKFGTEAVRITRGKQYDLVFATSSRLMTAVLGAFFATTKQAKLYLDIRDIFVDTIKDILPKKFALPAKFFFSLVERWVVTSANKVNLVSGGFSHYFRHRYPRQQFSFFTNGIDDEFIANRQLSDKAGAVKKHGHQLTVIYAGNLGEGQGLHAVLPELAFRMQDRLKFKIIGDGGRKSALEAALRERGLTSVELLPPVKRDELLAEYYNADVLFLHLNDYDAFKKVLPSKIFEYAALGKPIWAGVAGYSAAFIRAEVANAAVFNPCDVDDAQRAFEELLLQHTPRADFIEKYLRSTISMQLAADIITVGTT